MAEIAFSPTALPDPEDRPEFYSGILSKRALAWVVDLIVITGFTLLAGVLTLTVAWFFWPLTFIGLGLVYRIGTIAQGSATWGMRLMGIELRGHDGRRLDAIQSALHVGGYYAAMTFVLPQLASVVAMVATPRRQGLNDLLLGTAAINSPD